MRDKNLSYSVFCSQFNLQIERRLRDFNQEIKILRSAVTDSPTFLSEYDLLLPSSFRLVRGLVLSYDKLPIFIQWELLLLLEQKVLRFDFKKQLELKLLLSSDHRLKYLFLTERYTSHQIFGNFVNDIEEALSLLHFRRKSEKIVFPQRKRGYDDKGTLRSFDIWSEKWKPSFDWSLTEEQNLKERKLEIHRRTLDRLYSTIEERILD